MNVTVKIEGLEQIRAALQEAGPKLAKRCVRKSLVTGAQMFAEAARTKAPVLQEGTPQRRPGELRDSIDVAVKISAKEDRGIAHIGPKTEKGKGSDQPGVWGMFVEFGSIHGAPQPYLRPAFDQVREEVQNVFVETLRAGLQTLKK